MREVGHECVCIRCGISSLIARPGRCCYTTDGFLGVKNGTTWKTIYFLDRYTKKFGHAMLVGCELMRIVQYEPSGAISILVPEEPQFDAVQHPELPTDPAILFALA